MLKGKKKSLYPTEQLKKSMHFLIHFYQLANLELLHYLP